MPASFRRPSPSAARFEDQVEWPSRAREMHRQSGDAFERLDLEYDVRAIRLLIADTWRVEGDLARALAELEPELAALDAPDAMRTAASGPLARLAAWHVLSTAADPRAGRAARAGTGAAGTDGGAGR